MSKKSESRPSPKTSEGKTTINIGYPVDKVKGQVPKMENPPPPPADIKKDK